MLTITPHNLAVASVESLRAHAPKDNFPAEVELLCFETVRQAFADYYSLHPSRVDWSKLPRENWRVLAFHDAVEFLSTHERISPHLDLAGIKSSIAIRLFARIRKAIDNGEIKLV